MTKEMINEIGNYLREQIEDFDVRVNLALKTMDKMRCSLDNADCDLYDECYEKIEEWCEDNDVDTIYQYIVDVEEIIIKMDL